MAADTWYATAGKYSLHAAAVPAFLFILVLVPFARHIMAFELTGKLGCKIRASYGKDSFAATLSHRPGMQI